MMRLVHGLVLLGIVGLACGQDAAGPGAPDDPEVLPLAAVEAMTLAISPGKRRVYVGQPLRLDVAWTCTLSTKRLRSLRCNPEMFSMPDVEIVVPRCTAPEKEQLGVPFGGRRVIARRTIAGDADHLGSVAFPLFLRFDTPGVFTFAPTRLECVHLREDGGAFAPYAAYFNNGLFEPVEQGTPYERVFTESGEFEVEVRPLPEQGRLESFSGLFAPCAIDVAVRPRSSRVGQVLEVDLLVRSEAPHGFLDLPDLRNQPGLRSWFKLDRELGRAWDPAGTRFRARARTLTTRIKAFPALEVQVFDPVRGEFAMIRTEPVPLEVRPDGDRDYFDAKTLGTETASLSDQPEGVWQNDNRDPMDDVLNSMIGFLAERFWLLMGLGPLVFLLLLPWVREGRRRAVEPSYRKLLAAYRAFRRLPEGGADKWVAFHEFLATGRGVDPGAWTVGDARRHLRDLGVGNEDIRMVVAGQEQIDADCFSPRITPGELPKLNGLARRIFKLLGRTLVTVLVSVMTAPALEAATEWDEAAALFDQAGQTTSESPATTSLFTRSALKFEAAARSGQRPGAAWYNAGNAWFEAGEIGRSIACFRQAGIYRPFDPLVRDNLAAARALCVDVVGETANTSSLSVWPMRWLRALLVPVTLGFWAILLASVRYRRPALVAGSAILLVMTIGLGCLALLASLRDGRDGVVVVPELHGRKGPSYRYRTAFHEPLHDGLEFTVREHRDDWLQIQLADGRLCWIPSGQARLITTQSPDTSPPT